MSIRAIVLFAASALASGALAQDIGRVTRVTLYPGSATVVRAVRVAAGSGRVEMTGLPANFDVRTLRVEGDPGISIGEVAVQDIGRAEALSGRESELENRIQALKDEKAALDVEAKSAGLARDYLSFLSKPEDGAKGTRPTLDPKAIPAVLEAIRRGAADAYGTIQKVELRKRDLDKRIAAFERDLARARTGARDVRSLWIGYTAGKPGELRAAYLVTNAGWKPVYRAELASSASTMELERQAAVMQRTGEDWRGVTLRLSTGAPRATQVVEPQPWQLVVRPPVRPLERRAESEMAASEAPKAMRADDGKDSVVAQFQTAYTSEFEVPGKVDIASDGRQVSVSLASQNLRVKQQIRVVPRYGLDATVTAETEQPEGVWIPGQVQLYRDGSYIGTTYWNAVAKEKIVLPFGRDDRVIVKSDRVKNRGGESGILSRRGERQIAELYSVTSRHKVAVDLLVLEAAPVPVSDQINVVTLFQPEPKIKEWENKRGVVAWQQPLNPGETANFTVDYTIRYPKDANIIGLP
jgi:uncharacterized protein (TIGR02231 family)